MLVLGRNFVERNFTVSTEDHPHFFPSSTLLGPPTTVVSLEEPEIRVMFPKDDEGSLHSDRLRRKELKRALKRIEEKGRGRAAAGRVGSPPVVVEEEDGEFEEFGVISKKRASRGGVDGTMEASFNEILHERVRSGTLSDGFSG